MGAGRPISPRAERPVSPAVVRPASPPKKISSPRGVNARTQLDEQIEKEFQMRMGGIKNQIDAHQRSAKGREGELMKTMAKIEQLRNPTPTRRRQEAYK